MEASLTSSYPNSSVKVNVRLCGSIPRQEMECLSLTKYAPFILRTAHNSQSSQIPLPKCTINAKFDQENSMKHTIPDHDTTISQLCSQLTSRGEHDQNISLSRRTTPLFEPPVWAVPARGEARLEPVCDSVEIQPPVDLTSRAVFRIGRSPTSDVQLLHATSSRRHAMLFHHGNGSCYVVDCGSAHGTYVNGTRVTSPPKGGVVIPHRVKRGSMIRFGGPGAPTFVLKSFSFDLEQMKGQSQSSSQVLASTSSAVVEHNTRINALGDSAKTSLYMSISSKRSYDSMDSMSDEECLKSLRCSSPLLSPEDPLRLVSPDLSCQPNKRRRVSFSEEPPRAFYPSLVSPDLSSDENDCETI